MDYAGRKDIVWMLWMLDKTNPFEYFQNKYGHKATKIICGKITVPFTVPDEIEIVNTGNFQLKNYIMLA